MHLRFLVQCRLSDELNKSDVSPQDVCFKNTGCIFFSSLATDLCLSQTNMLIKHKQCQLNNQPKKKKKQKKKLLLLTNS